MLRHCTKCNLDLPLSDFYFVGTRGVYQGPCKECRKKRHYDEYQNQRKRNICVACGKSVDRGFKALCVACRNKQNEQGHAFKRRIKFEVFEHYGGFICRCCGDTHPEFLTLEHINGGGTKHRREVGYGSEFYRWLKKEGFPPGYEVLCMNCNWARGKYGYCPHVKEETLVCAA